MKGRGAIMGPHDVGRSAAFLERRERDTLSEPQSFDLLMDGAGDHPQSGPDHDPFASRYNSGPRRPTDRWSGFALLLSFLTVVIWATVQFHQAKGCRYDDHSNKVWAWDFDPTEWNCPITQSTCQCTPTTTTPAPTTVPLVANRVVADFMVFPIIVTAVVSLCAGALGLALFARFPWGSPYTIVAATVAAPGMAGGYFFGSGYDWTLVGLFVATFVLIAIFAMLRDRLGVLGAACVRSNPMVWQNIRVLIAHVFVTLAVTVVLVVLIGLLVFAWLVREVVAQDGRPILQAPAYLQGYTVLWAVVFAWFAAWAVGVRELVVSDVIGNWYWYGLECPSILRALKHALYAHGGTAAYSAWVGWVAPPICAFARLVHSHTTGRVHRAAEWILISAEPLIPVGILVTGVKGLAFREAGFDAGRVLWKTSGHLRHTTRVWTFPRRIVMASTVTVAAAVASCYAVSMHARTKVACTNGQFDGVAPNCTIRMATYPSSATTCNCDHVAFVYCSVSAFTVFVLVYLVLYIMCGVIFSLIDAAFVCHVMDHDGGRVTRPRFQYIFANIVRDQHQQRKRWKVEEKQSKPVYLMAVIPESAAESHGVEVDVDSACEGEIPRDKLLGGVDVRTQAELEAALEAADAEYNHLLEIRPWGRVPDPHGGIPRMHMQYDTQTGERIF